MKSTLDKIKKGTVRELWRRIRRFRMLTALVILASIAGNALVLLGPRLTGMAVDTMSDQNGVDWDRLLAIIVVMGAVFIVGAVFQRLVQISTVKLSANTVSGLRQELAGHIDKMSLPSLDKKSSDSVASLLTHDMNAIGDGLVAGLSQAFSGIVTLTGTLYLMFRLHAGITLILLVITPISFFVSGRIAGSARKQYQEESRVNAKLRSLTEEAVDQQVLLRSFNAREHYAARMSEINHELYTCGRKAQLYSSLSNPVTRLINALAYILVAAAASMMAVQGRLSIGNVASFLGYSLQFSKPINEITSVAAQFQSALASADRVFAFLNTETDSSEYQIIGEELKVSQGQLSVENLEFSYNPQHKLIENMNLSIESGSQVAIVGPTGAGKTTLVNLLMRFYDAQSGDIRVDEQSIYDVTKSSLRASFGMVLQDTWLFNGSIRDNIAFARPNAEIDDIIEASKRSGAHRFISRLPDGYDTQIGAGKEQLSAGQQQLLTIARTMLADPPMLILDEATSSVDTYTEKKIQTAFKQMMHGRTSFIIAHRLSTILDSDLILVMDKGTIVEKGTHADLMSASGFYAGLFNAQFAGKEI